MYDIVFISYNELNADDNWDKLKARFPYALRVDGVTGIHQAHIAAAKLAVTPMIWIVDGDATVLDSFNFSYIPARIKRTAVHVWSSINPVNDLEYGYGGVKLLPRNLTINMDTSKTDMTTSISNEFIVMNQVSNITSFNTDEFSTWRSAFRECVKLSSKTIDRQKNSETEKRLRVWQTIGQDRQFGNYAIAGARDGTAYGEENSNNTEALKKINDFDWMYRRFTEG